MSSLRKRGSRVFILHKERQKTKTLDSRLKMSGMTGGESGMTDWREASFSSLGVQAASLYGRFLFFSFCHSCESRNPASLPFVFHPLPLGEGRVRGPTARVPLSPPPPQPAPGGLASAIPLKGGVISSKVQCPIFIPWGAGGKSASGIPVFLFLSFLRKQESSVFLFINELKKQRHWIPANDLRE